MTNPHTLDIPIELLHRAQEEAANQERNHMTEAKLYAALAKAQTEMSKATKDVSNEFFKSKYADLSNVMDACLPALNNNGIALIQPTWRDNTGKDYVKTILLHGETGATLECAVPLIIGKNDMQGYGSAVTYARRYGLMSMAGIAPEDDDGNAAAKAAPKYCSSAQMKRQLLEIEADLVDAKSERDLSKLWSSWESIMDRDNWPPAQFRDDETAYRNIARQKFTVRKEQIQNQNETPKQVAE